MIRIAVVEDEPDCARELTEYLSRYGAESGEALSVAIFSDGDEIVEGYKNQFDIILMDVQM